MGFDSMIRYIKEKGLNIIEVMQGKQNAQQLAYVRQLQREINNDEKLFLPLQQLQFTVFDIETTGFYPEQGDQIISLGALKVREGKIFEDTQFYSLIYTNQDIPPEIEQLTGIRKSDLTTAPSLSEVIYQFYQFVKDDPLIAHHSYHEKNFLQHVNWKLYRSSFNHRLIDTSFLLQIAEPTIRIVKLEEWCNYAGIPVENRHHALGDAILTAQLWCKYIEKVQKLGVISLMDLYEEVAKRKK
ncbi:DNA polymerase III alpha subunit [Heyndrickxia sporothermodurans]|uniref:DNA polymerase III alpha subunit n=2 Tax=Heyndrickxia sporothermodurans TaxID=46224 RepID=A0A150KWM7_9BACI|nr:DNA polymerase III alpha subunit [Heyndrickxia sporothermodurans]